jgi:hypothetical protein
MFGQHHLKQLGGVVRNIHVHPVEGGDGSAGADEDASAGGRIEAVTFSLAGPSCGGDVIRARLVGRERFLRGLPFDEGDEVEVEGTWKPRLNTLIVTSLTNHTRGTVAARRRFV